MTTALPCAAAHSRKVQRSPEKQQVQSLRDLLKSQGALFPSDPTHTAPVPPQKASASPQPPSAAVCRSDQVQPIAEQPTMSHDEAREALLRASSLLSAASGQRSELPPAPEPSSGPAGSAKQAAAAEADQATPKPCGPPSCTPAVARVEEQSVGAPGLPSPAKDVETESPKRAALPQPESAPAKQPVLEPECTEAKQPGQARVVAAFDLTLSSAGSQPAARPLRASKGKQQLQAALDTSQVAKARENQSAGPSPCSQGQTTRDGVGSTAAAKCEADNVEAPAYSVDAGLAHADSEPPVDTQQDSSHAVELDGPSVATPASSARLPAGETIATATANPLQHDASRSQPAKAVPASQAISGAEQGGLEATRPALPGLPPRAPQPLPKHPAQPATSAGSHRLRQQVPCRSPAHSTQGKAASSSAPHSQKQFKRPEKGQPQQPERSCAAASHFRRAADTPPPPRQRSVSAHSLSSLPRNAPGRSHVSHRSAGRRALAQVTLPKFRMSPRAQQVANWHKAHHANRCRTRSRSRSRGFSEVQHSPSRSRAVSSSHRVGAGSFAHCSPSPQRVLGPVAAHDVHKYVPRKRSRSGTPSKRNHHSADKRAGSKQRTTAAPRPDRQSSRKAAAVRGSPTSKGAGRASALAAVSADTNNDQDGGDSVAHQQEDNEPMVEDLACHEDESAAGPDVLVARPSSPQHRSPAHPEAGTTAWQRRLPSGSLEHCSVRHRRTRTKVRSKRAVSSSEQQSPERQQLEQQHREREQLEQQLLDLEEQHPEPQRPRRSTRAEKPSTAHAVLSEEPQQPNLQQPISPAHAGEQQPELGSPAHAVHRKPQQQEQQRSHPMPQQQEQRRSHPLPQPPAHQRNLYAAHSDHLHPELVPSPRDKGAQRAHAEEEQPPEADSTGHCFSAAEAAPWSDRQHRSSVASLLAREASPGPSEEASPVRFGSCTAVRPPSPELLVSAPSQPHSRQAGQRSWSLWQSGMADKGPGTVPTRSMGLNPAPAQWPVQVVSTQHGPQAARYQGTAAQRPPGLPSLYGARSTADHSCNSVAWGAAAPAPEPRCQARIPQPCYATEAYEPRYATEEHPGRGRTGASRARGPGCLALQHHASLEDPHNTSARPPVERIPPQCYASQEHACNTGVRGPATRQPGRLQLQHNDRMDASMLPGTAANPNQARGQRVPHINVPSEQPATGGHSRMPTSAPSQPKQARGRHSQPRGPSLADLIQRSAPPADTIELRPALPKSTGAAGGMLQRTEAGPPVSQLAPVETAQVREQHELLMDIDPDLAEIEAMLQLLPDSPRSMGSPPSLQTPADLRRCRSPASPPSPGGHGLGHRQSAREAWKCESLMDWQSESPHRRQLQPAMADSISLMPLQQASQSSGSITVGAGPSIPQQRSHHGQQHSEPPPASLRSLLHAATQKEPASPPRTASSAMAALADLADQHCFQAAEEQNRWSSQRAHLQRQRMLQQASPVASEPSHSASVDACKAAAGTRVPAREVHATRHRQHSPAADAQNRFPGQAGQVAGSHRQRNSAEHSSAPAHCAGRGRSAKEPVRRHSAEQHNSSDSSDRAAASRHPGCHQQHKNLGSPSQPASQVGSAETPVPTIKGPVQRSQRSQRERGEGKGRKQGHGKLEKRGKCRKRARQIDGARCVIARAAIGAEYYSLVMVWWCCSVAMVWWCLSLGPQLLVTLHCLCGDGASCCFQLGWCQPQVPTAVLALLRGRALVRGLQEQTAGEGPAADCAARNVLRRFQ